MNCRTYNEIKRIIRTSITLNNGYQFDDLCHDTIEKLINLKKTDLECIKLCRITALNLIRDHHRKCEKLKTVKLYELESEPILNESIEIIEPINYKEIYTLKYKFGMKLKEISEFSGVNYNTVRGNHVKMKKELKILNL